MANNKSTPSPTVDVVTHSLAQSVTSAPSADTVQEAWLLLTTERSRLIALSIALAARMEDRERAEEHDSTELLLAQLLEQHLSSMSAMNKAYDRLTCISH